MALPGHDYEEHSTLSMCIQSLTELPSKFPQSPHTRCRIEPALVTVTRRPLDLTTNPFTAM